MLFFDYHQENITPVSNPSNSLVKSSANYPDVQAVGMRPPGLLLSVMRHKVLASSLLVGILAFTTLIILFYPRKYHSTSKLLMQLGRENVTLDPTASTAGETQMVMRTRESEVVTALEMMASREILQDVVDSIGAEVILSGSLPGGTPNPPGLMSYVTGPIKGAITSIDPIEDGERAVLDLENNIEISAPSEAGVVTIEYITDTPELAQEVVSQWVSQFQEHYIKATRTRGAFEFFVEQETLLSKELRALRQQLKDSKTRYGLVTIEGQQRLIEQQLQTVRLEKLSVDARVSEIETRITSLEQLAGETSETRITQNVTGLADEAHARMLSRLYDLQVDSMKAKAYLADDHPKLIAIQQQLAKAEKVVSSKEDQREEVTEGINPTRQILEERLALERAELQALRSKSKAIDTQDQELRSALSDVNTQEQVVAELDRRMEILEERYRVHAQRYEQARLDKALEEERISSVNVVQKATLEFQPVSPRKKLCALLGVLAGIAAAVGIPTWIEAGKSADLASVKLKELLAQDTAPSPGLNGAEHTEAGHITSIPR